MSYLWRLLRSKGFAIVLLVALVLAAGLGNTVPQMGRSESGVEAWRAAHPTAARWLTLIDGHNVFSSDWFIALLMLLALSTLACMLGMANRLLKGRSDRRRYQAPGPRASAVSLSVAPERLLKALRARLTEQGYDVRLETVENGYVVLADRYSWAEWTGIVFHLSLVVLLGLAALNAALTWRGFIILTEGDVAARDKVVFHSLKGERPGPGYQLEVGLTTFLPRHRVRNYAVKPASIMEFAWGEERTKTTLTTEQGYRFHRTTIFQGNRYGVTFRFTAEAPGGPRPFSISLPAGDVAGQIIKTATLPGGERMSVQTAYTDQVEDTGLPLEKRFSIRVAPWRETGPGEVLPVDPITAGETVAVGADRVTLTTMRYWSSYAVVHSPLTEGIYTAAWVGVGALLLGFFCYRRRLAFFISAAQGESQLAVQAEGNKNRWLVEREGEAVIRRIRSEVDSEWRE